MTKVSRKGSQRTMDDLSPKLRWYVGIAGGIVAGGIVCAATRALFLLLLEDPFQPIDNPLAGGLSILAGIVAGAYYCYTSVERNYRPPHGHCPHCGYNLRGLPEPRCPECGRPFEVSRQATRRG